MAEETFNICTTGPALAALLHSMALQGQRDYDGLILGESLLGCQALDSQVRQPAPLLQGKSAATLRSYSLMPKVSGQQDPVCSRGSLPHPTFPPHVGAGNTVVHSLNITTFCCCTSLRSFYAGNGEVDGEHLCVLQHGLVDAAS